ncbi:hypothetical protein ACFORH_38990 [Amycolatopsis roodepoortensis]|uniref:Plasmid mobilization relaxosome protein MobC n=1 Tax=Amycolatopsis roodepoortensis TaxID=700274 RepID=A0ABR9LII1_9PSEU|nr:hypothetical protein [Amycolatopsis roodepoortensis]MBE1580501.1 hypothetical protein [Amycolatopsis roodepoortensis]
MTTRRRGRLDGETRTKRTAPIDWAPSELLVIETAAAARGQSPVTFIAQAALAVASGRYRLTEGRGPAGLTAEQVTLIRQVLAEQTRVRRLLASVAGSLNQLAATANSGVSPTTQALHAALTYLRTQLSRHNHVTNRLADLIAPR